MKSLRGCTDFVFFVFESLVLGFIFLFCFFALFFRSVNLFDQSVFLVFKYTSLSSNSRGKPFASSNSNSSSGLSKKVSLAFSSKSKNSS